MARVPRGGGTLEQRLLEGLRLLGSSVRDADALARADALWLARVLPSPPPRNDASAPLPPGPPRPAPRTRPAAAGPAPADMPVPTPASPPASATTSLFVPQPGASGEQLKARRVSVPVADALPGRANLERALRPFLRRRASAIRRVLDAEATAEASAHASVELLLATHRGGHAGMPATALHALVPVLRAVPERWFDVAVLAEDDETMHVFDDTISELQHLLSHHGAFGTVRLWRWAVQGAEVVVRSPSNLRAAPRAMLQAQRPQLVLVLTHGASPHWEGVPLREFVRGLASRAVVAIVQMLPEPAWTFTTLGEATEFVRARERATVNRLLQRLDPWTGLFTARGGVDAVPMLTLDAPSVNEWARWLMSPRLAEHRAVALDAPAVPVPAAAAGQADTMPQARDQVLRFRGIASPQAFALLRLLAASWITLPVMRLLLNSLPGPRSPAPLAEVLLSGLLVRQSQPGVPVQEMVFDFVPGVREWLLGSLSGAEQRAADDAMADSRESIRRFVEAKTGKRLANFDALLFDPRGTELLPASARSFVEVSRRLRSLRGLPASPPGTGVPAQVTAGGALHDFPLPARDLVPRPELEQQLVQRVLALRMGSTHRMNALPGSGAVMLMARVLAHPAVRRRFVGGIWFDTAPPPRVVDDIQAPRLHLARREIDERRHAGDTRIEILWPRSDEKADIGYLSRTEAAAYFQMLGLSQVQARRLESLHRGMPLLVQLVGVGTTLGVFRWPRLDADASLDDRFDAYVPKVIGRLQPAQVDSLMRMAARRPRFPGPALSQVELAARLGWLCPGQQGTSDTLHPDVVSHRLEAVFPSQIAAAHRLTLHELRASLDHPAAADYVRQNLLDHAEIAGGVHEVCRVLFDRRWLAVLLGADMSGLLKRLQPLAKDDARIAGFAQRLSQAVLESPNVLQPAGVLDTLRTALAPQAAWRARMHIDEAHRANLTGAGVHVALVATGVDAQHPELQHLAIDGDVSDPQGHGTAMGSVIAGRIVGIAPGIRLWSLAALDEEGKGTSVSIAEALSTIGALPIGERPDIVCLPLGMSSTAPDIRQELESLAALGMVLVAAAGNDGRTHHINFPASMPQVLAVGALAAQDEPADFSNTGPGKVPELWAPGTDIVAAIPASEPAASSTALSGRNEAAATNVEAASYSVQHGTSFSCAAVAGLAALYAQATGLRGNALRNLLVNTAIDGHARFVAADAQGMKQAQASAKLGVPNDQPSSSKMQGEPLRGHESSVQSVAFSPDGTRLASGSREGTVQQWDATTGQALGGLLRGHKNSVLSVSFSPDGRRLASGSRDGTVRQWDVRSGRALGEPLRGHKGSVLSVAFNLDGTRLISGSRDGTLRQWDASSGQALDEPLDVHEGVVESVAFSPDGTQVISGSADGTVRMWDAYRGQPLGEPLRGHMGGVQSVAFRVCPTSTVDSGLA